MKTPVCDECKVNPWKYKCPGCSIRTCGLACVKAHKKRTDCTGKKKATDFVPLSKFDDNLLLSDYNLLEETKRVAESALRTRIQICKPMANRHPRFEIPYVLRSLYSAGASRGTKLCFLPSGMSKREKNQSRYNLESKCISWTIEWRFESTDVVLMDHGVGEDTKLCSVIMNHLKPGPWIHKLKPFCDVDMNSLRLFVRQFPKRRKSRFKELDIRAPLRQQLAKVVVLEYPVIYVYLPSQSVDFEVIRDFNHIKTGPDTNGSNGIPFREEELEDDSESKVIDLRGYNSCQRVLEGSKVDGGVTDNSHPQVDPTELWGGMELEFDDELIDTFTDLVADMDPSEFEFESDPDFDLQNLATNFDIDDGLEEGEIVE
ncbi:hypothetical protein AALP_AA1G046100 [Arabis alpina]|uniref:HIT-type domain-containing protein n=1 Tax=Arabis alpina TaxID=50452 RepID=A0A087HL40_ARAAL|nr:hypothetical protein AALP_AA1G046100 [Arabis alpina]